MQKDFLTELDSELSNMSSSDTTKNETTPITKKTATKKIIIKRKVEVNKPLQPKQADKRQNNNLRNRRPQQQPFRGNFPETKFYLPSLRKGYTRLVPIGGHDETGGKNMMMFQYEEDILLIDGGMQFPEDDMFGADYSIPDISFLIQYKNRIKGMLITHGHLDHIGALKHILPALGMPPIYGTKLTLGLVKKILEEQNLLSGATLIEVNQNKADKIRLGNFSIEFFSQNHSIPDSAGLFIETPGARVVHTGDFKIDFAPSLDAPASLSRIGKIGEKGIDILMSDSTNSLRKGFTKSEREVGESLDHLIKTKVNGRMIIATFASGLGRVQQIIKAVEDHGKTAFLSGRSMLTNVKIAKELGYIKSKPGTVKKLTTKTTEGIPEDKQVIITTGSQGEEFAALSRMANGTHPAVSIKPGDTVAFSATPVPGNERKVVAIMNRLIRLGANLITTSDLDIYSSGHAYQEEQKIMLNLVRPRYFIPIHGELFLRDTHRKTAIGLGIPNEKIIMTDNGIILDIAPNGNIFRSNIKVPLQQVVVDGHGIGLSDSHVMRAREKMMNSGVLAIIFKVDKKSKTIIGPLKIETRGLVYLDEVRDIHRLIIKKAKFVYENTVKDVPEIEEKDLIKIIKTDVEGLLLQKIDRDPMIIPVIVSV